MKKIFVEGNIFITTGNFKYKDLVAYASEEVRNQADIVIPTDLIISNTNNNSDYESTFYALKDIISYDIFYTPTNIDDIKEKFTQEISNLKNLIYIKIDDPNIQNTLYKQTFVGIISAMEVCLSDTLIYLVRHNSEHLKNFIKSYTPYKEKKIKYSDLIDEYCNMEKIIINDISNILFHNLPLINKIYSGIEIRFPDIEPSIKHVNKRHDLVHRNGKNKDGEIIFITQEIVLDAIKDISVLVYKVLEEASTKG